MDTHKAKEALELFAEFAPSNTVDGEEPRLEVCADGSGAVLIEDYDNDNVTLFDFNGFEQLLKQLQSRMKFCPVCSVKKPTDDHLAKEYINAFLARSGSDLQNAAEMQDKLAQMLLDRNVKTLRAEHFGNVPVRYSHETHIVI